MADRDRAPVDVHLVPVGADLLLPGQDHRREGFVDLEEVDVLELQAGLLQYGGRAWDRTLEHEHRVGADDRLAGDPGARPDAELARRLGAHEQDRGCTVRDLARVGGRDAVLRVEGRLKRRRRLVAGVGADALVLLEQLLVAVAVRRDLDGHDLRAQVALLGGLLGEPVAADAELVHLLARDPVLARHQLGRDALRHQVVELHELRREGHPGAVGVRAHGYAGHALDAARDRHVADAALDQVGGEVDGLLAGAALAVDSGGRRGDREPGRQPGVAGDVDRLLADLAHTPEDDVVHLGGLDPGPLQELFQHQ